MYAMYRGSVTFEIPYFFWLKSQHFKGKLEFLGLGVGAQNQEKEPQWKGYRYYLEQHNVIFTKM